MNGNLRVARALIGRGIPTAPVAAVDKTPLTTHGFHDRTTNAHQIEEWAGRWPGCLWLLVPADVGAIVFDVDSLTSRAIFDRLGLANRRTYFTETPGGFHVAFRNVVGLTGGRPLSLADVGTEEPPEGGKADDKLVVRIGAGYVIAPGCVRADGARYVAHGRFAHMAPLPDAVAWLLMHAGDDDRRKQETARSPRIEIAPDESVIVAFNRANSVAEILERNGYRKRGKRWVAPNSETGMPGVVLLEGRAYSHHGSDPLACGHTSDAFGCFLVLEHGGDVRAAVRAAAESLGLQRPKPAPAPVAGSVRIWTPRRTAQLRTWRTRFERALTECAP